MASGTNPRRATLASLPVEIVHQIIECARSAFFVDGWTTYLPGSYLRTERELHLVFCQVAGGSQRQIMQLEDRTPVHVLDTFQSLASVNQPFYELCRPLLWKVSTETYLF